MTKLQFVYACSDQAGDCSLCTTASKPSANYFDLLAVKKKKKNFTSFGQPILGFSTVLPYGGPPPPPPRPLKF